MATGEIKANVSINVDAIVADLDQVIKRAKAWQRVGEMVAEIDGHANVSVPSKDRRIARAIRRMIAEAE